MSGSTGATGPIGRTGITGPTGSQGIYKNTISVSSIGSIIAVNQQIRKIIYLNGSTDYIEIYNIGFNSETRTQNIERSWFQARFLSE